MAICAKKRCAVKQWMRTSSMLVFTCITLAIFFLSSMLLSHALHSTFHSKSAWTERYSFCSPTPPPGSFSWQWRITGCPSTRLELVFFRSIRYFKQLPWLEEVQKESVCWLLITHLEILEDIQDATPEMCPECEYMHYTSPFSSNKLVNLTEPQPMLWSS